MAIDLTDFTAAFRCNEAGGANLVDFGGTQNWTEAVGTVLSAAGKVEDPSGTTLGRGWLNSIGSATTDYFSDPFSASDIWDIRGQTSCTFAGWFLLSATVNGVSIPFTIHDASVATGQAFQLYANIVAGGANATPRMTMYDGLTLFNVLNIKATDSVSIVLNTWNFIVGGYDADRNKIFNFWGRAAGESYYAEADGFAAGFGYTGVGASNGLGEFGTGSAIRETRADQLMWWNGRALTQDDMAFLWNNHSGRAFTDLTSIPASLPIHILKARKKKKRG